jgi:hypothetical protein
MAVIEAYHNGEGTVEQYEAAWREVRYIVGEAAEQMDEAIDSIEDI